MRRTGTVFMLCTGLVACTLLGSHSSYARDGFYIGSDMGLNVASSLDTMGSTNDLDSRCDQILFGEEAATDCESGALFSNSFSGATGFLAGAFAGYKYRDFRLELEYLYRNSKHDDESSLMGTNGQSSDKLSGELSSAVERINQATSNNVFVNVYYDIPLKSRFSPYLGAGAGVSVTDFGYALTVTRNPDPEDIDPENVPNGTLAQRSRLAGTTTTLNTTLTDTLFTFQVLGGVDYWFSDNMALGLKGRWVWFDSFSGDDKPFDQLRSHASNNGTGTDPVVTNANIDSFHMYGVTLNLKYMFGDS